MIDGQGRRIHYLRISVTDRCNLRCAYCMPESGITWMDHGEILTYEEILRLARIFADLGVDRVRLTGGEPLVRKGLFTLVSGLKEIPGINWVGLTTNGLLLEEQLPQLLCAGLDAVNISLDTLNTDQYRSITRRDGLAMVLRGIEAARQAEGLRVRLNCVPTEQNEDQWVSLARLARCGSPLDVRFIELMPIGLGRELNGRTEQTVLERLEAELGPAAPIPQTGECGPSRYVRFPDFAGRVGFISALTHQFCDCCNRVRLTASGVLKPCLQYDSHVDLKTLIRGDAGDEQLTALIRDTIYRKPAAHHFAEGVDSEDEQRSMNQIGG